MLLGVSCPNLHSRNFPGGVLVAYRIQRTRRPRWDHHDRVVATQYDLPVGRLSRFTTTIISQLGLTLVNFDDLSTMKTAATSCQLIPFAFLIASIFRSRTQTFYGIGQRRFMDLSCSYLLLICPISILQPSFGLVGQCRR